jgi:hypothetical protein
MKQRREEPFEGEPPTIAAGELVWCRTLNGRWVRKVALDGPRYDHRSALGSSVWLSVPVADLEQFRADRFAAPTVNWPAEDVRRDLPATAGSARTTSHDRAHAQRRA